MADQRIQPLNDAEQKWVADELINARRLVVEYSPSDVAAPLTPEVLDRAFKAAYQRAPQDEKHANATINAIGIAFGQFLVDRLGLQWCAVFDKHGSELAVVGLPGKADMLVFPPNLVAKRWTAGTTDFLGYVFKEIEKEFAKFREDWENHSRPQRLTSRIRGSLLSWLRRLFSRAIRN